MGLTTQTFDILSRIAIGNGALIYRAVEKTTLRQVALKLLSQEGELDHRMDLDALFAAAPRLKQITGAHVCQLLDAYSDEDGPVLVYEFANGISGAELPHKRALDAAQALDVAAQLISSLRSGERQKTPHGDLKPSQIIFVDLPDGRPFTFVLDWGLAAFREDVREDSLPYLAPERLAGEPPSHSADLFSAGAVLFYLYTGKVLVAGTSPAQLATTWSTVKPEVLGELRPDLPSKLVQLVCSLLRLNPVERPSSAIEAGSALAALNPPPAVIAPESIRPRPAGQRSVTLPGGPSSIAIPASSIARPIKSGVRSAPTTSTPAPRIHGPAPVARPQTAPASKSKGGLITAIVLMAVVAAGVAGWVVYKKQKAELAQNEQPDKGAPSKPPAPSVSRPIDDPSKTPKAVANASNPAAPNSQPNREPKRPPQIPQTPQLPPKRTTAESAPPDPIFIGKESFSYDANAPFSAGGTGTGWLAPWRGPAAKVEASSLSYPGHKMEGGSLVLSEAEGETMWTRRLGPLSSFIKDPKVGGHWYCSFLVQHSDDTPARAGDVIFNPFDTKDPHNFFRIVITDDGVAAKVTLLGLPKPEPDPKMSRTIADASKPIFVVCRIDLTNPKFDNWDVKTSVVLNPNLAAKSFQTAGDKIEETMKYVRGPEEIGFSIRKKRSQATTRVDEIRYGKHWEEMVFQPPQKDADEK